MAVDAPIQQGLAGLPSSLANRVQHASRSSCAVQQHALAVVDLGVDLEHTSVDAPAREDGLLAREEVGPDLGLEAVRADHEVACETGLAREVPRRLLFLAAARHQEVRGDAVLCLLQRLERVAAMDMVVAEALPGGGQQHHVQPTPVDGVLRRLAASLQSPLLPQDDGPRGRAINKFARLNAGAAALAGGLQGLREAEVVQDLNSARQNVDSSADLCRVRCLLEDLDPEPGLVQRQGCSEAADAAAHDQRRALATLMTHCPADCRNFVKCLG
mmetsp:Transcript_82321/g.266541  ORF Transcript_82321/g.266541 Transcript_82321/m.266541 type:complete len:272 (+) Transcript_82321:1512-2327(+)